MTSATPHHPARKGRTLRILGAGFLMIALLTLVIDVVISGQEGALRLRALGEWWYAIDKNSLNLFQVLVQRYIEPYTVSGIWFEVIQPVLLWPAAVDFAVPGALLFLWGRQKARGGVQGRAS
ncbi:MAG: hypothetical protein HXY25_10895 [Alphaproteobacteria bacterium]|nr:hypothetical protein [Alphaproteobacteria bacterium]